MLRLLLGVTCEIYSTFCQPAAQDLPMHQFQCPVFNTRATGCLIVTCSSTGGTPKSPISIHGVRTCSKENDAHLSLYLGGRDANQNLMNTVELMIVWLYENPTAKIPRRQSVFRLPGKGATNCTVQSVKWSFKTVTSDLTIWLPSRSSPRARSWIRCPDQGG